MENQTPNTVATTPAPQPTPVATVTSPVTPAAPGTPPASPVSTPVQSAPTDVMGIISIVLFFVGIAPIGLVLGLIGMSSAKKNNRSTTISKIGTILNAIGVAIGVLFVILVLAGNLARR